MVSQRKSQKAKIEGEEGAHESALDAVFHGSCSSKLRSASLCAGELDYHTREATRARAGAAVSASNKSKPRKETAGFQNPPPPPSSAAVWGAGGNRGASGENYQESRRIGGLGIGTAGLGGGDPDRTRTLNQSAGRTRALGSSHAAASVYGTVEVPFLSLSPAWDWGWGLGAGRPWNWARKVWRP